MNSISNKRFAERILVPVGTMDREAVAGMDRHLADLEVLAEPDRDSAGMEPLVFPGGDDRLHDVACTEPFLELLPRSVPDREAVRVRPAAVPLAVPTRLDQKRPDPRDVEMLRSAGPDARGIQPMSLGQVAYGAVKLRPPSRSAFDW